MSAESSGVVRAVRGLMLWWGGRRTILRWGAVVGEVGAIWWLSSRESLGFGSGWWGSLMHNSAHVFAYGLLGILVLLARCGIGARSRTAMVFAVVCAAAYGLVDEIHQSYVPGRVSSVADLCADTAGAALGCLVVAGICDGGPSAWRRAGVAGVCAAIAVATATWTTW